MAFTLNPILIFKKEELVLILESRWNHEIKFIIQIFFFLSLACLSLYLIPFSYQNTSRLAHSKTTKVIREANTSKLEIKVKVYHELFKCDNYYDNSILNKWKKFIKFNQIPFILGWCGFRTVNLIWTVAINVKSFVWLL